MHTMKYVNHALAAIFDLNTAIYKLGHCLFMSPAAMLGLHIVFVCLLSSVSTLHFFSRQYPQKSLTDKIQIWCVHEYN